MIYPHPPTHSLTYPHNTKCHKLTCDQSVCYGALKFKHKKTSIQLTVEKNVGAFFKKNQYCTRCDTNSGTRPVFLEETPAAVPLRSLLPSAPPMQAALYPFGGLEVVTSGLLVTTRTMVTEDWAGFWSTWMGCTWPAPPGTKARAFPGPEGRTVGWGGAAMMTG